jgi:prevent-host-death family protein
MNWHLQDAKNNFSKVVQQAIKEGPQTVTLRGAPTVIVLSVEDYGRMREKKPTFVEHLLSGSMLDDDIIEAINWRDKRPSRDIEF